MQAEREQKAILAAILSTILLAFLLDVLVVPWFPLPAILYAPFVLIAAHMLRPTLVLVVIGWDTLVVLAAAWVQQGPWDQIVLYETAILVLGYLTVLLARKTQREGKLKVAMAALAEERQRGIETLRALVDALPVAVIVSDGSGTPTLTNAAANAMFEDAGRGEEGASFQGLPLFGRDGAPLSQDEHPIWRCLRQEATTRDAEVTLRVRGRDDRLMLVASSPMRDQGGVVSGAVAVFQDLTDHQQVEERLLAQQRALAVLEERERLSRDLHDNLGQVLAYLSYQGESIRKLLSDGYLVTADVQLARLIEVSQQLHSDLREHIVALRTPLPCGGDLTDALQRCVLQVGENSGLDTRLIVDDSVGELRIASAAEVELLRIIQEALTNVGKHAGARKATVTCSAEGERLSVVIQDDGHGFDSAQVAAYPGHHYGLQIMRERAQGVGGSLQVSSERDQGTMVTVSIPARRHEERVR